MTDLLVRNLLNFGGAQVEVEKTSPWKLFHSGPKIQGSFQSNRLVLDVQGYRESARIIFQENTKVAELFKKTIDEAILGQVGESVLPSGERSSHWLPFRRRYQFQLDLTQTSNSALMYHLNLQNPTHKFHRIVPEIHLPFDLDGIDRILHEAKSGQSRFDKVFPVTQPKNSRVGAFLSSLFNRLTISYS